LERVEQISGEEPVRAPDGADATGPNVRHRVSRDIEFYSQLPLPPATDNPAIRPDPTQPVLEADWDRLPINPLTKKFDKACFIYDAVQDVIYCPRGEVMAFAERDTENNREGETITWQMYGGEACATCPLAARCISMTSTSDRADERVARVLLIDRDPGPISHQLRRAFPAPLHQVHVAASAAAGLQYVRSQAPDVIVLALDSPQESGFDVYRQIRGIDSRVPVIFVTESRRADAAIEVMKQGAYECLFKPLDLQGLDRVISEALKVSRLMREPAVPVETPPDEGLAGEVIIGCCRQMQEACKAIGRVADHAFPVLITGESGTGKELVARAIYQHGPRAQAPFLALNCAAIPENLLESELFGHEKGAFTGADRRRIGKFEQCSGGTLFLDEIGDMPSAIQAKMLRVLQEQTFERVGGNETIRTDVRLIAATHRDLKIWSEEGKFRPDLYYRLSVFTIHLPPLRERRDDQPLLVQHYVRRFSRELGRDVRQVAPDTMSCLCGYSWPGNIRELQSVLKQALLQASGTVLLPAFLPEHLQGTGTAASESPTGEDAGGERFVIHQRLDSDARDLYAAMHRQLDRLLLPRVLDYTCGNQQHAALLLGIARQTLRLKIRDLGASLRHL
jgi:two-component system nitrogen regulation response regulator GlnG